MDPLRACKPLSLLSALWLATTPVLGQEYPVLDQEQLAWIGDQIYNNECNRKADCLTAWNTGEEFPSLGIGHFIWYPAGQDGIYEETFPALLAFLRQSGASLPGWLGDTRSGAPWRTRDEFLADLDSARMGVHDCRWRTANPDYSE